MDFETIQHLILTYRYLILLPIAIIEGPMLAIVVGVLTKLGHLSLIPAFLIMVLGDFLPDTFYYYLGRFGKTWKFSKKFLSRLDDESTIIRMWHRYPIKTLILSKLAFALSPALLVTTGISGIRYRLFITISFIVTVLQYSIFIAVGYFIGYSERFISNTKYFAVFIAVVIIIFFIINMRIQKKARKEIEELEAEIKPQQ